MLRKPRPDAQVATPQNLSPSTSRKSSTNEKRKISRVHLGRIQFTNDEMDVEPDPKEKITQYDFFMAASSGKLKTVRKYLDDGGDVNTKDNCKRTALHRAALYEQEEIVKLLLKRGAKVNSSDKLSNTPLHWACRGTNLEVVRSLLKHNAKINTKDMLLNGPLHVATRVGFVECVDYLLECGANLNDRDSEGDTPIHDAVRLGRPKVVRTLVLHGANMEMKNKTGKTAVDMVQAWYNNTKQALAMAEAERERKGLDAEKLAMELQNVQCDTSGEASDVDSNKSASLDDEAKDKVSPLGLKLDLNCIDDKSLDKIEEVMTPSEEDLKSFPSSRRGSRLIIFQKHNSKPSSPTVEGAKTP